MNGTRKIIYLIGNILTESFDYLCKLDSPGK